MNIAKIKLDGSVISTSPVGPVNVGEGEDMIQYPRGIFVGASQWTDAELNAIGYAHISEDPIPPGKVSTGHTDTFVAGRVVRSHVIGDAPVVPDASPSDPDYDYARERQKAYPSTSEMLVALWEAAVEGRPEAQAALEVERRAVKARFPKK
jgi:hypothetical protein